MAKPAERYSIEYTVPGDEQPRFKQFDTSVPHTIEPRFMRANPKAVLRRIFHSRTGEQIYPPLGE